MTLTPPIDDLQAQTSGVLTTQQREPGHRLPINLDLVVEGALRPLNHDFHSTLRKRLRENGRALEFLSDMGLDVATVDYFGLGLSAPYINRKNSQEQADALVYPLRARDGSFVGKYGYHNIPGVTKNPVARTTWIAGESRTYYAGAVDGKRSVMVCAGTKDLWRIWQALQHTPLADELLLIASTNVGTFPKSWKDPSFWSGWETVYFGHDEDATNEQVVAKLAELIGREARRVVIPEWFGNGWVDFWRNGGGTEEFTRLLEEAPVAAVKVQPDEGQSLGYGRFPYQPLNINGAYRNGFLYHTAQVLRREVDLQRNERGEEVVADVERLETVVIRSDRTVHTARWVPAPRGTRERDRILRLSDGTLIDREPQPNKYGTWSWPSIGAYLEGATKTRPLAEILRDVMAHLRSSVWFPFEDDYAILALVVPVTYAQRVFESVPLIFLNGPPASGKSETGRAMARVCANAYVCGQSSAASIARFIDESKGFVVLDDLEVIGEKSGEFGELAQALKLSYNKTTAVKLWTDVRTMRTQLLDFYGVKMINNTRGADGILGSRMLRIQTRRIPEALKGEFAELISMADHQLAHLRDELHTWTFENVAAVEEEYRAVSAKGTDRAEEIMAPLRVMASLSGDAQLKAQLERALARQQQTTVDLSNPIEVIKEALKRLVVQGYDTISITHLVLEIRDLISNDYGKSFTADMAEWACPETIGRMLRREGLIDFGSEQTKRIRVKGANLRFYPISTSFVEHVSRAYVKDGVEINVGSKMPQKFCQECDSCQYRSLDCEIMKRRKSEK
jgi:hypothetical protein